jgi:hypothetical protein
VVRARGTDMRAAQEKPARELEIVEDVLDRYLAVPKSGDHDKSTSNAHDRDIGLPFVAH